MAESKQEMNPVHEQIKAVIYGNCIGDAMGLLTEFMNKDEAMKTYGNIEKLAYSDKVPDFHRARWEIGDWTDDSDQMILIIQSIINNNGKVLPVDFAGRLRKWRFQGFPEFGDSGGCGIGQTTAAVLSNEFYRENPHRASELVWKSRGCQVAPNGGVMRTSVLGCYKYNNIPEVTKQTLDICKVTHFDPRCQASCVVVTTSIALMLQRDECYNPVTKTYDVERILKKAFDNAVESVFKEWDDCEEKTKELKKYVFEYSKKLKSLKLDESVAIGYTYKCLGSGCWAFRQDNFETAIQKLIMEAGDADTNGAVAGAMLGCKLGMEALDVKRGDSGWLSGLIHKDWLDNVIERLLLCIDLPSYRVMSDQEMNVVFKESAV